MLYGQYVENRVLEMYLAYRMNSSGVRMEGLQEVLEEAGQGCRSRSWGNQRNHLETQYSGPSPEADTVQSKFAHVFRYLSFPPRSLDGQ